MTQDQEIVEIETEKVNQVLYAPEEGVLNLTVKEGYSDNRPSDRFCRSLSYTQRNQSSREEDKPAQVEQSADKEPKPAKDQAPIEPTEEKKDNEPLKSRHPLNLLKKKIMNRFLMRFENPLKLLLKNFEPQSIQRVNSPFKTLFRSLQHRPLKERSAKMPKFGKRLCVG